DRLVVADFERALSYPADITPANTAVHPTAIGYTKMAKVWFDTLTRVLPTADVLTQRNNNLRSGVSSSPGLDQAKVKDFQLLRSLPVDAPVLAQPLVVHSQNWKGSRLSVVWIATAVNTIYAFNADPPYQRLYKHNLGPVYYPPFDENHQQLGAAQLTYLNPGTPGFIGIESTPVIDLTTKTLFVSYRTSKSTNRKGVAGQQHLAAIDMTSDAIRNGVKNDVIVPGNDGWYKLHRNRASLLLDNHVIYLAFAGIVEYNAGKKNGYGKSWQGWIHAFDAASLSHLGDYRTMRSPGTTPGDSLEDTHDGGGIWQASTGLSADGNGSIFFATGNANKNPAAPDVNNVSSSVVRLNVASTGRPRAISMKVADWFTPYSKLWQDHHDMDFASAGVVLIPGTQYMVAVGKEAILYVLDRNNMGRFDSRPTSECSDDKPSTTAGSSVPDDPKRDHVQQKFQVGRNQYFAAEHMPLRACGNDFHLPSDPGFDFTQWPHVHGTPVFGDFGHGAAFLYVWPEKDHLKSFRWLGNQFNKSPAIALALSAKGRKPVAPLTTPWKHNQIGQVGMPGAMLSLSVDPTKPKAGVLFASLQTCGDGTTWRECTFQECFDVNSKGCSHQDTGMLRAFDPITLTELWNDQVSTTGPAAQKNYKFAKFVPPTVTKGRVYLATASREVRVYGSNRGWQGPASFGKGNLQPGGFITPLWRQDDAVSAALTVDRNGFMNVVWADRNKQGWQGPVPFGKGFLQPGGFLTPLLRHDDAVSVALTVDSNGFMNVVWADRNKQGWQGPVPFGKGFLQPGGFVTPLWRQDDAVSA
ncbi:MAG: hypothetical protein M3Z32_07220, partial [Acidobacteriota bacterium]|nr:hypothetical protein [Acidobacteriota bacterium]